MTTPSSDTLDTPAADHTGIGGSLLQSLQVVLSTYGLTLIGILWRADETSGTAGLSPLIATGVVILFTVSHAVVPIFVYWLFFSNLAHVRNHLRMSSEERVSYKGFLFLFKGFLFLHMGIWYLSPILGLAYVTGSLAPAWMLLHVVFAKRPDRTWVFLQYGSTSVALLLFVLCLSITDFFPLGVAVVAFQTGLLTLANWKGKKLWDSLQL
jgi:hypothetical protein